MQESHRVAQFGVYEADLQAFELRKDGRRVRLHGQPFEVLSLLLERPGELVTREELRERLWPKDTFVDFDHGLNSAVNRLREALNDSAESPRYIATVPRRGYRFIAPVSWTNAEPAATPAAPAATETPAPASAAPAESRRAKAVWLWAAAAVLAVAVVAVALDAGGLRTRVFGAPVPEIHSLAVLPFENLSADPEQEYFADGMTEEMISQLAQIRALRVISRTSAMQYKQAKKPLRQIARELGVDAVVEGSVQRAGDRVRVSAQLIHAPTDRHLWAASYERDISDVLRLQSEVARAIAGEIRVQLTPRETERLAETRPVNPEAYQLYLKGRFYQEKRRTPETTRALVFFEQAIEKDPTYVPAYVAIAEAGIFGRPPRETMPRAKAAAQRALELNPRSAEAHSAVGLVKLFWEWDWSGAEAAFRRALELNPNHADAHHRYSLLLAALGRFEEAIAEAKRAVELDPVADSAGHTLGRIYYFARRYDEAIAQYKKVIAFDPQSFWSHYFLSIAYDHNGESELAAREWMIAQGIVGTPPERITGAQQAFRRDGFPGLIRYRIEWEKERYGGDVTASNVALMFSRLGEKEEALRWLEKSFQAHTRDLIYLQVEPQYDPIRGEPRFQTLLRRMNFPSAR